MGHYADIGIWLIESSFRKLKYTVGLSNYHSYKPEYVKQEIWANLIAYNMTKMLVNCAVIEKKETKYEYRVNFTMAAHICRVFLRLAAEKDQYNVMPLLQKELIPYGMSANTQDCRQLISVSHDALSIGHPKRPYHYTIFSAVSLMLLVLT